VSLALAGVALLALAGSSSALALTSAAPVYEYVSYGPSPMEVANIYPSSTPQSPIVILIHGGGWRNQGPLGRLEWPARGLQRQGFTVLEINYDQDSLLATAFPLEPTDLIAAVRWAKANAAGYNGNPSDVVLVGGSAGGHLAALVAERLDSTSPGAIRGVVTLSGPMNFITLMPTLEGDTYSNDAFVKSVHRALGFQTGPYPRAYAEEWSPALHLPPSSSCPNWLIFNSESEFIPLSQAQEMSSKLGKAGCNAKLEVLPGSEHGFAYFHTVKPMVISFIKAQ
jgi:acetyl esterase/lipase